MSVLLRESRHTINDQTYVIQRVVPSIGEPETIFIYREEQLAPEPPHHTLIFKGDDHAFELLYEIMRLYRS